MDSRGLGSFDSWGDVLDIFCIWAVFKFFPRSRLRLRYSSSVSSLGCFLDIGRGLGIGGF